MNISPSIIALHLALFFSLGCSPCVDENEFNSGYFLVSTTAKSTGVSVTDSLYVDRYSNDSIHFFDFELYGRLSDGNVILPNQIKKRYYSDEYHCSGVVNVLNSDSLFGHIAVQSGNKIDTLILQFKRLSNRASGQKYIKEINGRGKRILTYRDVDDTSSRFMLIHEAQLVVEGNKLTGLFSVHAQGSAKYILHGTKVKDQFVGEYITCDRRNPTRVDSTIGDFKLKIVDDYIDLRGDFPFIFENRIKRIDGAMGFHDVSKQCVGPITEY